MTNRLVLLSPKIDVDPSDIGYAAEGELTEWRRRKNMEVAVVSVA